MSLFSGFEPVQTVYGFMRRMHVQINNFVTTHAAFLAQILKSCNEDYMTPFPEMHEAVQHVYAVDALTVSYHLHCVSQLPLSEGPSLVGNAER